jgi:hypothetical protein
VAGELELGRRRQEAEHRAENLFKADLEACSNGFLMHLLLDSTDLPDLVGLAICRELCARHEELSVWLEMVRRKGGQW